ncbi:TetR/AcrR family transcriptional regulator [Streptomyces sp. NPDC057702]|uniref:TetR/AcrR family transcriptional regulator n=1 Tax=unclassified Streptomyces TaxID=2593676 RepID=UPI0036C80F5F
MPKVRQEHLDARRQQIIDAARNCFARNGFHQTSMQNVFAESGLSAGAVYRYFKSKDELIATIATDATAQVRGLVNAVLQEDPPPPPTAVFATLVHGLEPLRAPGGVGRIMIQVWGEALRDPALRTVVAKLNESMLADFAGLARRFSEAGHLPPDADAEAVSHLLLSLVQGYVVQNLIVGPLPAERYLRGLDDMLWRAAAPYRSPPGAPGRRDEDA